MAKKAASLQGADQRLKQFVLEELPDVQEVTRFLCTDGTLYDTMDEACDHQDRLDFATWCQRNLKLTGDEAKLLADRVAKEWRVQRKARQL